MKTDRVDIFNFPEKLVVKKYAEGWNLKSRPSDISEPTNFTFDEIVTWFKNQGWQVVEWESCPVMGVPQGARAYRNELRPVRSRWELLRLRKHYNEIADSWFSSKESFTATPTLINRLHVIDLAYLT